MFTREINRDSWNSGIFCVVKWEIRHRLKFVCNDTQEKPTKNKSGRDSIEIINALEIQTSIVIYIT